MEAEAKVKELIELLDTLLPETKFVYKVGKKYFKLCELQCGKYNYAQAFIDMETGNVYRAASYNSPNKSSKVNISNINEAAKYLFSYRVNFNKNC